MNKMTIRVALVFGLGAMLLSIGLCVYQHRKLAVKGVQKTENGFGESRAVPAPTIDETEAPLPLNNGPFKVSFKTKASIK